jgi:hypothetical protein
MYGWLYRNSHTLSKSRSPGRPVRYIFSGLNTRRFSVDGEVVGAAYVKYFGRGGYGEIGGGRGVLELLAAGSREVALRKGARCMSIGKGCLG